MGNKNKICIVLMGIMLLQCMYIVKNTKRKENHLEVVQKKVVQKEEVSSMYRELAKYDGVRVIEIKGNLEETIGEVEITGSRTQIISKINDIKKYKIIDYEIDFSEEILKVNIEVK